MSLATGTLVFAAIAVLLGFGCAWLWRLVERYRAQLRDLNTEVKDVATHSAFGSRIEPREGQLEYNELSETINQLFEALHAKDEAARQRERLFRDLADTMPEVILVHTDKIYFANREAGELFGMPAESLIGRDVPDPSRVVRDLFAREGIPVRRVRVRLDPAQFGDLPELVVMR